MARFNPNIPLRVGAMAYVAVVALGLMSYMFYKAMFQSMFLSGVFSVFYIVMALLLAIWSGIAYRSFHGNVISFRDAFLSIYIVFAFCALGNAFSTVLVNKLVDKDFPRKVYEIQVAKTKGEMKVMNKTPEQQQEELAKIHPEDYDPSYGQIARNLGFMLAGTAVFSLLVAVFIKRSSEDLIRMNTPQTGA
ncbi:MAG: DUF4199 domain-containing protein [Bacteroidetes bacterium]|nr:DUF4199 domain-containing protein [Bacteroidota bacterium]